MSRDQNFLKHFGAAALNSGSKLVAPTDKVRQLMGDSDHFLKSVRVPTISRVKFQVEGVSFQIGNMSRDNNLKLMIWATLGYLPFSAVSAKKRQMLLKIIFEAQRMKNAKLGVDENMQIVVKGQLDLSHVRSPDYFFLPMLSFMQETLPYIRIIGEHL